MSVKRINNAVIGSYIYTVYLCFRFIKPINANHIIFHRQFLSDHRLENRLHKRFTYTKRWETFNTAKWLTNRASVTLRGYTHISFAPSIYFRLIYAYVICLLGCYFVLLIRWFIKFEKLCFVILLAFYLLWLDWVVYWINVNLFAKKIFVTVCTFCYFCYFC